MKRWATAVARTPPETPGCERMIAENEDGRAGQVVLPGDKHGEMTKGSFSRTFPIIEKID